MSKKWTLADNDHSNRANLAGEELFAVARDHEIKDHDGEVCIGTRASIIAMVAHGMGLSSDIEHLLLYTESMIKYEEERSKKGVVNN